MTCVTAWARRFPRTDYPTTELLQATGSMATPGPFPSPWHGSHLLRVPPIAVLHNPAEHPQLPCIPVQTACQRRLGLQLCVQVFRGGTTPSRTPG